MSHKITVEEADIVTCMLLVMAHATERAVEVLEEYHAQQFEDTDEYRKLVQCYTNGYIRQGVPPMFARKRAEREASVTLREINSHELRENNTNVSIGEWKRSVEAFHKCAEQFTAAGINTANLKDKSITGMQMFDSLIHDSQFLCRIFLMIGNIPTDDFLKVESTLKAFGKRNNVPVELMNDYFTPNT